MQSEWQVDTEQAGQRLDLFLAEKTGVSRSRVEKLIREGCAQVDGALPGKP